MEGLREAKQGNVDVINIAFPRAADIEILWDDLKAEMTNSVEQPVFSYRTHGRLMTLFSENCGEPVWETNIESEGGVPCICLTLDGPAGRMMIINACWPVLPSGVRKRLLTEYMDPAMERDNCTRLIGGELGAPMVLESLVRTLDLD